MITNEAASSVEETTVTLGADVAPEHVATSYQFEYLTEARYKSNGETFTGATTVNGAKAIAAEEATKAVTATITGLTADTTYDYRVVATNRCAAGGPCVTDGPTKTLTTLETPSTAPETCPNAARRAEQPDAKALPDCRAYEMVSPKNTFGQSAVNGGLRASEAKELRTGHRVF